MISPIAVEATNCYMHCMHSPDKAYVCEGQAIAMYAQFWEGLGLWGTSQCMHSPEKAYVCEGQAIAMYAQSWEGLGLWGTSQCVHSPDPEKT